MRTFFLLAVTATTGLATSVYARTTVLIRKQNTSFVLGGATRGNIDQHVYRYQALSNTAAGITRY